MMSCNRTLLTVAKLLVLVAACEGIAAARGPVVISIPEAPWNSSASSTTRRQRPSSSAISQALWG